MITPPYYQFVVAVVLAGCAAAPVQMDMVRPFPTPRFADLADRLRPLRADEVVHEDLPGAPEGSFEIDVTRELVRVAASDGRARAWALLTLEQISVDLPSGRHIRPGRIRDRPAFPLRGGKRLLEWELAYRANLAYEREFPGVVHVAVLSPGGVLDATEAGIELAARFFRENARRGVRHFVLEFDDVGFGLTADTADRFGTYPRAISHYLSACREALRDIAPDAALYWLPQTYWTSGDRLLSFARDVGSRGGLPGDLGLVVTGPDVISQTIRAGDVDRARRAFGLTGRRALVYDNLGREGDHGPLTGRGPDLPGVADAVFGERGEPLNRLTRLDYAWNPAAYDPGDSHLLACREIVGPAAAAPLSRLIREGPRLGAAERLLLYREAWRKLDPPARAPVPAGEYLPRIWLDVRP